MSSKTKRGSKAKRASKTFSAAQAKMSASLRRALVKTERSCKRCRGGRKAGNRTVSVIMELRRKPTRRWMEQMCKRLVGNKQRFRLKRRMTHLRFVAAEVSTDCLKNWCRHRHVRRVHLNRKLRVSLQVATPAVGAAGLQRRGVNGRNVTIAIIDTGVYPHPDLTRPVNRIVAFKDLINGRKRPYDDNGHGTHVAGDAAGNGFCSQGKFRGPATRARLVAVKAFDRFGDANSADVTAAIDWVLRHRRKYKIRILNLSFGSPGIASCNDDPVCRAAERAWKAGLLVVAAAGNSGPAAGTIESPGISPLLLTVGAVNDHRTVRQSDDTVADFSSRGPVARRRIKPDLAAPGVDIVSLRAPGSVSDRGDPSARVGRCYFTMSGTSMAAPIVSGGAAQLLQRFPLLTNRQVKRLLMRNAFRLKRADSNAQGRGELNVRFLSKRVWPAAAKLGGRRRMQAAL